MRVIWEMSAKMSRNSRAQAAALPLSPPLARPGMLVYLVDAANLITLGGLAISLFACWAVLLGRPSLAMALAALAVVIDNVDGYMARRTMGRNPALEQFGAHFIVMRTTSAKAYSPSCIFITATDLQVVSILVALIYLMAIAFRYSYEFVPDRAHIGLSPDYIILFLCLLQLATPQLVRPSPPHSWRVWWVLRLSPSRLSSHRSWRAGRLSVFASFFWFWRRFF